MGFYEMNTDIKRIGEIGNYYGGLSVKREDGKYYWSIEDWHSVGWEEIPPYLYGALIDFEVDRRKKGDSKTNR